MLWSYMTSPLNYHDFHREVCTVAVLLARLLVVTAVRLGEVLTHKARSRGGSFLCLFDSSRTNPPGNWSNCCKSCVYNKNQQTIWSNMQQHAAIKKG